MMFALDWHSVNEDAVIWTDESEASSGGPSGRRQPIAKVSEEDALRRHWIREKTTWHAS